MGQEDRALSELSDVELVEYATDMDELTLLENELLQRFEVRVQAEEEVGRSRWG